jgi:hypothetical protein
MGFGNAGLLLGALLGALPIIIHLVNRHRARLRRFAAIEFLLLSDKRLARRLKLKQLLVLALRVALIVALAVALAKPYLEPAQTTGLDVSAPGAVAIVIDDSASMGATDDDGETALSRALSEARRLVSGRGVRTSVAILTASRPARLLTEGVTFDSAALETALERVRPTGRGQDLAGALREAGRVLSESGEARRQIVVLSDNAAHAWSDAPRDWPWAPVSELTSLPLGVTAPNVSVAEAHAVPPAPGSEGVVIEASLVNHGGAAVTAPVTVRLGSLTASEVATLAPDGRATVSFRFERAPDSDHGEVVIEPSDLNRLAADDRFGFMTTGRRALRVLLVNGAPVSTDWLDELYFARPALALPLEGLPPMEVTALDTAQVTAGQVAASDVVVLANVGALEPPLRVALEQLVERGGGLLITAGDRLDPQASNGPYGALLPSPLRELRTTGRAGGDPQDALQALTPGALDFGHPVLSAFKGLADASLLRAQVSRYLLVDASEPSGRVKVLASLSNGAPLLVEGGLGRGRILLWTTSLDRDWADLALRPSFPPLLQRSVAWLARALEDTAEAGVTGRDSVRRGGYEVGDAARVPAPEGGGPVVIRRPDGGEVTVELADGEDDVFIPELDLAGLWELQRAGERERARFVMVNTPRSESALTAATTDQVEAVRALLTRDNGVLAGLGDTPQATAEAPLEEGAGRTLLWPWILAGLFVLFASEAWLLVRS